MSARKVQPKTIETGFRDILQKFNLLDQEPPKKKFKKLEKSDDENFSDEEAHKVFDTSEKDQKLILKSINRSRQKKKNNQKTPVDVSFAAEIDLTVAENSGNLSKHYSIIII